MRYVGILLCVFILGVIISFIPRWMRNNQTRKQAQEIASVLIKQSSNLSEGQHQIILSDLDLWEQPFHF